jgi:hypothetical protein
MKLVIVGRSDGPYRFEPFLNAAEEDQVSVLGQLAYKDRLYLALYGDRLRYRITRWFRMRNSNGSSWTKLKKRLNRLNQIPHNEILILLRRHSMAHAN